MRSTWTDSRLDDLNDRVKSMDEKMGAGFARMDGRIDDLNRSLVHGMIALISIITVLLTAFLAVVITHL